MGFLAPWFLAGIVAAGLPLWLHLLKQYRRTPQPFSSLMFFERRLESSAQRRRFAYLVLLALRVALILLLALAFANPFLKRNIATASRRKLVVIVIDRSFSMRYDDAIAKAKREAHRVLDGVPRSDLVQVLALDLHVEALARSQTDRDILRAAIDSIQATDLASSFGELARALRVIDQTSRMHLNVQFISDVQQSSMPADFKDLQLGPHISLALHCIGERDPPNWAVESVSAPARVHSGTPKHATAMIRGWNTPAVSRRASLLVNGRLVASKDIQVPPNGHIQVDFVLFDVPYGANRGEVRIEPHDGLPSDDALAFSVERSDARPILFLYHADRPREPFFYKAAMESASDTGLIVETIPVENANSANLSKYAFVVLGDIGELGQILEKRLSDYVSRGGAILISVGPSTARAHRIPITGDRVMGTSDEEAAGLIDNQHPAMLGIGRFANVRFFNLGRLSAKPGTRMIARFADGTPLFIEQHIAEGRALTFNSTFDNASSDFYLHASFLPFVVQTAKYLAGSEESFSNLVTGTPVQLRRGRDQATAADVIGPDGKHELSLNQATMQQEFDLTREGFYEVQRADDRRLLIAAHADRRESDLTRVPDETLALWRNTGDTARATHSEQRTQETRSQSLWRYALLLALAVAVLESAFASRYVHGVRKSG